MGLNGIKWEWDLTFFPHKSHLIPLPPPQYTLNLFINFPRYFRELDEQWMVEKKEVKLLGFVAFLSLR